MFPNEAKKLHWHTLHELRASQRQLASVIANEGLAQNSWPSFSLDARLPVVWLYVTGDRRRFDLDGAYAACKGYQDGLSEAVSVDDSFFRPVTLDTIYLKGIKRHIRVQLGGEYVPDLGEHYALHLPHLVGATYL